MNSTDASRISANTRERQQHGVVADLASGTSVVDEPAGGQRCAPKSQSPATCVSGITAGIDQIGARVQVVLHDQQAEARDPGQIGLPA